MKEHFITGYIQTCIGDVPQVTTQLQIKDIVGAIKVRWALNRNSYRVNPGLYAVGNPNSKSDVFVTANYKLSFDTLRKNLDGINAWILVLDTKGINVWCAAGKGTFGTRELVNRIQITSLNRIVDHRRLILPQLGAVGVSAHRVKEETANTHKPLLAVSPGVVSTAAISFSGINMVSDKGFSIKYGPVRASDIKEYIASGYQATHEMRKVSFDFIERIKLIPVEIVTNARYLLVTLIVFFILSTIEKNGFNFVSGKYSLMMIMGAYLAGTVLTPALLPWIPCRSFSLKGFIMGLFVTGMLLFVLPISHNILDALAWILVNTATSSFLAMNFTGASTFTSLSGVKKEMKIAVPLQLVFLLSGLIMMIFQKFQ